MNVMTAFKERDASAKEAERRAGDALQRMTTDEGLTLREAVEWCGDSVDLHEAARLRKLSAMTSSVEAGEPPVAVDAPTMQT